MNDKEKTSDKRREYIVQWLKEAKDPLTGQSIAERTNVSRQIIVQDISILKAKKEPIYATAQGYIYIDSKKPDYPYKRLIACKHTLEETKKELTIIVDYGVFVKDVIVEHPIYGELTASLRLKNRRDVYEFINKLADSNAALLSSLTDGVHLHTIEAESIEQLDEVYLALQEANMLLSKTE